MNAGLLLIDKCKNTCLIKRHMPYDQKQFQTTRNLFLEAIQIPRGGQMKTDKSLIDTATREFLEETHCINKSIIFYYRKSFQLYWYDENIKWKYTIFIGFIDDCFKFDNALNKFQILIYDHYTYPYYLIKTLKYWNIIVMNLTDYISLLQNLQLKYYNNQHNYNEFIHFLQSIKIPINGIINCNWLSRRLNSVKNKDS
jgi:hypothetical protein